MITLAGNERTPARGDSKQVFARDFTSLENKASTLDKKSVELYVHITKVFIADRDKTGVSLLAWSEAWREQFPYRAVSTIRGHLTYTVKCADAGYDLSTFETLEHFRQKSGTKTRAERNDSRKPSGNGSAFDAILKPALSLSTANKKKLIAELMASL